jgi:putative CocE/NonD family hydrolase
MRGAGRIAVLLTAGAAATASGQAVGVAHFGVATPMRDGVKLVSNIWLPDSTGRHPTILFRTPYDKTPQFRRYGAAAYVKAGYAVVLQDTRGRGDSEGEFDFYFPDGKDGYDTIEWIAKQPWSNGRVAMDGGSYLGTVQYLAAREQPPHLACIAPDAPSGRLFDEIPYQGGAYRLEWALPWIHGVAGKVSQSDLNAHVDWKELFKGTPLASLDRRMGRDLPFYQATLAHPTLDAYWKRIQFGPADFARINVPVLTVTGWFDGDQLGALFYWDGMEKRNDPKNPHWLIIGPWTHAQTYLGGATKVGAFTMDSSSILEIQKIRLQFFDWCLKQSKPSFDAPKARVFVVNANQWRTADRYPLPEVEVKPLYLRSGGKANTAGGDGTLSWDPPGADPADQFSYDPKDPVPSFDPGADHRKIEERSDVLVYTTPELTAPVEVVGRVFVKLFAATDATDTDFTAKLLDVHPDGRAIKLGPVPVGVIRARYRKGYERTEPVTPNQVEEYSIELFDVGYQFQPGHRIRLEISSSAAPYVSANHNTGNPVATDTAFRVARQTIHHDSSRPSRILLPLIPLRP